MGELAHTSKVVAVARIFLRRMIGNAHLCTEFCSGLFWWHMFVDWWNGVSLLAAHISKQPPSTTLFTDTSGTWSCGATDGKHWEESCQYIAPRNCMVPIIGEPTSLNAL
jgi:hypothetical protein